MTKEMHHTIKLLRAFAIFVVLHSLPFFIEAYGESCGAQITETTGEIVSPGFPMNYSNELRCLWAIEASERLSLVFELKIEDFQVEQSENCTNDSLTVYDGPTVNSTILLPPSCGSRIAWPAHPTILRSTGKVMTIEFTTNDAVGAKGFRASFRQVTPAEDIFLVVDGLNAKIYKQNRFGVDSKALPVSDLIHPVAVDYDPVAEQVYFTDVRLHVIGRINIDGSNQETLVTSVDDSDGLAIDYVSRIMYWTEAVTDTINLARLDGSLQRILLDTGLDRPRAIVFHCGQGYIYWSDWGAFPKIERCKGDGSDRSLIVSHGLNWPNGITVEKVENKLYWVDAGLDRIERCNLDGSQRELLIDFEIPIHPFDLIVLESAIFWTDWESGGINVVDRNFEEEPSSVIVNDVPTNLLGLALYSSEKPLNPKGRDCSLGRLNSGCDELCVAVPTGHACLAVAPVFETCPEDIHIFVREPTRVEWNEPSVSSPSGVNVSVTSSCKNSSSTIVPALDGTVPVTYSAIDIFGNIAHCFFSILVTLDTQPPTLLVCPENFSEEIPPSQQEAVVDWREPEVVDNLGNANLVMQSHQSGSRFVLGETEVVYLWQDEAMNTVECRFTIKITEEDDEPPVVTMCPEDISEKISPSQEEALIEWVDPEVSDNSGTSTLVRQSHQSGSLFDLGETVVVYIWQDESKNTAECRFKVQVTKGKEISADAEMSPTIILVSIGAVASLLIAVSIGVCLGKFVKCQCSSKSVDQAPLTDVYTTAVPMNETAHHISDSQPTPNVLSLDRSTPSDPQQSDYAHRLVTNSSDDLSACLEITPHECSYSRNLPLETGDEDPPPLPDRPSSSYYLR